MSQEYKEKVYIPCPGKIIDITETSDEVIAEKLIGDGMAVIPENDYVCAPVNGEVNSIMPSNHAFQMRTDSGVNLLVHIGIDTVELEGKFLDRLVEENQVVERGTPIIKANFAMIKIRKYDPAVIVILLEDEIKEKTIQQHCEDLNTVLYTV